jgi:hypothetical protein
MNAATADDERHTVLGIRRSRAHQGRSAKQQQGEQQGLQPATPDQFKTQEVH